MSMGRSAWTEARTAITLLLTDIEGPLRDNMGLRKSAVIPMVRVCPEDVPVILHHSCSQYLPFAMKADVTLHMPANIGDYTDFYASKEHASNCGSILRGVGKELNENW